MLSSRWRTKAAARLEGYALAQEELALTDAAAALYAWTEWCRFRS